MYAHFTHPTDHQLHARFMTRILTQEFCPSLSGKTMRYGDVMVHQLDTSSAVYWQADVLDPIKPEFDTALAAQGIAYGLVEELPEDFFPPEEELL